MNDLAVLLANRVQLTTLGRPAYLEAVGGTFGAEIDSTMLGGSTAIFPRRAGA